LEHLKDAGIDTFWLSPVFKSPQKDTGYDVSDYYQIEPDYGNMNDFDNLIAKAKSLGLRVLLDFIPNHTRYFYFYQNVNNRIKNLIYCL
jgi:alpha-glucosidase